MTTTDAPMSGEALDATTESDVELVERIARSEPVDGGYTPNFMHLEMPDFNRVIRLARKGASVPDAGGWAPQSDPAAWQWRAGMTHQLSIAHVWTTASDEQDAREFAELYDGEMRPLYAAPVAGPEIIPTPAVEPDAYAIVDMPNSMPNIIGDVCLTKQEADEVVRSWSPHGRMVPLYRAAPLVTDAVLMEQTAIARQARHYASNYAPHSDGRNTFIILAEWIEARAALQSDKEGRS